MGVNKPENDHWNDLIEESLHSDLAQLNSEGHRIFLLGDFNGHINSQDGGSAIVTAPTNSNGQRVLNICSEHNLHILNTLPCCVGTWSWMRGTHKSVIDYALGDFSISSRITSFTIDDGHNVLNQVSDHNWFKINLKCSPKGPPPRSKPLTWRINENTNWDIFRSRLESELCSWENEMLVDNEIIGDSRLGYSKLVEILYKVGSETVGFSSSGKPGKDPKHIRRAIKVRNACANEWKKLNRASKPNTNIAWNSFLAASRRVKYLRRLHRDKLHRLKQQKRARNSNANSRSLWSSLNNNEAHSLIPMVAVQDKIITNPSDVKSSIQLHIQHLLSDLPEPHSSDPTISYSDTDSIPDQLDSFDVPFNLKECSEAIAALASASAPGWDQIPNEFLKNGGPKLHSIIFLLLEDMRGNEWMPSEWSEDKLVLIHKKKNKAILDNYRGIAISNSLQKVFTRILERRLRSLIENNNWLSEIQGGFRDNRSTIDQLFILTSIAERAKATKNTTFFAFIDLKKAFDSIPRPKLWSCLKSFGLGGKFSRLLQTLYSDHKCKAETIGGWTDWVHSKIGVKQGCVLSPLLFNLYLTKVEKALLQSNLGILVGNTKIPALFFADDMVLMAESEEDLNILLTILIDTLLSISLFINFDKSELLIIGKNLNSRYSDLWPITDSFGNTLGQLKIVDSYRYLGIVICNSILYSSHLSKSDSTCMNKSSLVKILSSDSSNRIEASSLLWLGKMIPAILYGAELIIFPKKWINKTERAQLRLARFLLRVNSKTSSLAIRRELGWSSINEVVESYKLRYWDHLQSLHDHHWAKQTLNMILTSSHPSKWYSTIVNIRRRICSLITPESAVLSLAQQLRGACEASWTKEAASLSSLSFYPLHNPQLLATYLNGPKNNLIITKYRLENWSNFNNSTCSACGILATNLKTHILIHCKAMPNSTAINLIRSRAAYGLALGHTVSRVITEILDDPSYIEAIIKTHLSWLKKGGICSMVKK